MDSNIPVSSIYGVYVSRLIAFARIQIFKTFQKRHKSIVCKLLKQVFSIIKLKKVFFFIFQNRYLGVLMEYHDDFSKRINTILSEKVDKDNSLTDTRLTFGCDQNKNLIRFGLF